MFWLVMSESVKAREESESVFDTSPRVSPIPAERSHKNQKSRTAHFPDADKHLSLLIPNSSFPLAIPPALWYNILLETEKPYKEQSDHAMDFGQRPERKIPLLL